MALDRIVEKVARTAKRFEDAVLMKNSLEALGAGQNVDFMFRLDGRCEPVGWPAPACASLVLTVREDKSFRAKATIPEIVLGALLETGWRFYVRCGLMSPLVEVEPGTWFFDHKKGWFLVPWVPAGETEKFRELLRDPARFSIIFLRWRTFPLEAFRLVDGRATRMEYKAARHSKWEDSERRYVIHDEVEVKVFGEIAAAGPLFEGVMRRLAADPRGLVSLKVNVGAGDDENALNAVKRFSRRWAEKWRMVRRARSGGHAYTLYPKNLGAWLGRIVRRLRLPPEETPVES